MFPWTSCLVAASIALSAGPSTAPRVDAALARDLAAGRRPVAVVLLDVPELESARGAEPTWEKAARAAVREAQGRVLRALEGTGWEPRYRYLTVPALTGRPTPAALAVLERLAAVRRVGPDARLRAAGVSAAAYVGAEGVRAATGLSGAGVTVAILDSGLTVTHPDFAGRVLAGGTFLDQGRTSPGVDDDSGHGTNVAGLLASAGVVAPPGVAPGARLLIYKVLDAQNGGWVTDWIAAADHAAANFARWPDLRVVNNSLESEQAFAACPCADEIAWVALASAAWGNLTRLGALQVACTGNRGLTDAVSVPACLEGVLGVGAVYDRDFAREPDEGLYHDAWPGFAACADETTGPDVFACFTNVGACLDVLAPGVQLLSSDRTGRAATWYTGTSQSVPLVAGAAALLAQAVPQAAPDALAAALGRSGVQVQVPGHPSGTLPRLDVARALAALREACGQADGAAEPVDGVADDVPAEGGAAAAGCGPTARGRFDGGAIALAVAAASPLLLARRRRRGP